MKPTPFTKTEIALAFSLIALRPALAAENKASEDVTTAAARSAQAEAAAHDSKAALAELDFHIDAIEEQLDNAPDEATRQEVKTRLEALKQRRSELRRHYVQAKFEELKADTAYEYARVSVWAKNSFAAAKKKITGPEPGPAAKTRAMINPQANQTLAEIAVYRLNPSPENKEDVKQALKELEAEIDRLEAHARQMPDGADRNALERRIAALEDREDELSHDFTKARWDALVADLRREWTELVN